MASLSTSIPIYLEMNLSVIRIEWVAPIHRRMMAKIRISSNSNGTTKPADDAGVLRRQIADSCEIVA